MIPPGMDTSDSLLTPTAEYESLAQWPRIPGAILRPVAPLSSEGRQPTEWGFESPNPPRMAKLRIGRGLLSTRGSKAQVIFTNRPTTDDCHLHATGGAVIAGLHV